MISLWSCVPHGQCDDDELLCPIICLQTKWQWQIIIWAFWAATQSCHSVSDWPTGKYSYGPPGSTLHLLFSSRKMLSLKGYLAAVTWNENDSCQDYLCDLRCLRGPILEPQILGQKVQFRGCFCKFGLVSFNRQLLSTSLDRRPVSRFTAAWWLMWRHRGQSGVLMQWPIQQRSFCKIMALVLVVFASVRMLELIRRSSQLIRSIDGISQAFRW